MREPGAETILPVHFLDPLTPFLNSCMQGLGMRPAYNTGVDINVVGGKHQYYPWVFGRGYMYTNAFQRAIGTRCHRNFH